MRPYEPDRRKGIASALVREIIAAARAAPGARRDRQCRSRQCSRVAVLKSTGFEIDGPNLVGVSGMGTEIGAGPSKGREPSPIL
jgi:hypothetical protein